MDQSNNNNSTDSGSQQESTTMKEVSATNGAAPTKTKKEVLNPPKVGIKLKKAPGAPRRFKTAFIFFSTAKHKEFREALGKDGSTVKATNIAKMVGKAWKNLSKEERQYWDDIAAKDKARYELERSTYTGPWQVVDTGRDPMAPRRPCSAFINFLNYKRDQVKRENPDASSIEVMRLTAKLWREHAPEREVFEARAMKARENYRKETEKWKEMQQRKPEAMIATQREDMAWSTTGGEDAHQSKQEDEDQGHEKGRVAALGHTPTPSPASSKVLASAVGSSAAMNRDLGCALPSLPLSCTSSGASPSMATSPTSRKGINPFVNKRSLAPPRPASVSLQLAEAERILRTRSLQQQASIMMQLSSDPLMEAMGFPVLPPSLGALSTPAIRMELSLLLQQMRTKRELLLLKLLEEGR